MSDERESQQQDFDSPSDSSNIHDSVAAYALNALSTVDRYAFEAHLAECTNCRREYARFEAAAVFLPDILARIEDGRVRVEREEPTDETPPSIDAKSTLATTEAPAPSESDMVETAAFEPPVEVSQKETSGGEAEKEAETEEAAEADTQESSGQSVELETTPAPDSDAIEEQPENFESQESESEPASEETSDTAEEQQSRRPQRPRGRIATGVDADPSALGGLSPGSSMWWWIATAIIGAIGLISFLVALFVLQQNSDLKTERESLSQQVRQLEQAREEYLDQTPAVVYSLAPTTLGSPDSSGSIFVDPSGNSAILSVSGMPPQPSDQIYQVFYVVPGAETSAPGPIIPIDDSGNGIVAIDPAVDTFTAVGITIEPAGGSTTPSSDPVLQVAIQP